MKLKPEIFMKIFIKDKELDFSNYSAKSKYYDDSNKLVAFLKWKIKQR